jgi:hypothetical protein
MIHDAYHAVPGSNDTNHYLVIGHKDSPVFIDTDFFNDEVIAMTAQAAADAFRQHHPGYLVVGVAILTDMRSEWE